jgi:hypothetical protein
VAACSTHADLIRFIVSPSVRVCEVVYRLEVEVARSTRTSLLYPKIEIVKCHNNLEVALQNRRDQNRGTLQTYMPLLGEATKRLANGYGKIKPSGPERVSEYKLKSQRRSLRHKCPRV